MTRAEYLKKHIKVSDTHLQNVCMSTFAFENSEYILFQKLKTYYSLDSKH